MPAFFMLRNATQRSFVQHNLRTVTTRKRQPMMGATENARLENLAPSKTQGWKTRDRRTRHQLAGVENEGVNCMDSQWDNFCNLLK